MVYAAAGIKFFARAPILWLTRMKDEAIMMKANVLFWGAILFVTLGCNAGEGYLFFFFGSHLLVLAVGLHCMNRESKAGTQQPAGPPSEPAAPVQKSR